MFANYSVSQNAKFQYHNTHFGVLQRSKVCMGFVCWWVRQLRVTKDGTETWLTKVIRHAVARVTVLVAVVNSRMVRTTEHVPGCAYAEFHFCSNLPLPFGAAILKPDFDLSFCKFEGLWKLRSARDGQVFTSAKFALEFLDLCCGESRSLSLLGWIATSSSFARTALVLQHWKRKGLCNKPM